MKSARAIIVPFGALVGPRITMPQIALAGLSSHCNGLSVPPHIEKNAPFDAVTLKVTELPRAKSPVQVRPAVAEIVEQSIPVGLETTRPVPAVPPMRIQSAETNSVSSTTVGGDAGTNTARATSVRPLNVTRHVGLPKFAHCDVLPVVPHPDQLASDVALAVSVTVVPRAKTAVQLRPTDADVEVQSMPEGSDTTRAAPAAPFVRLHSTMTDNVSNRGVVGGVAVLRKSAVNVLARLTRTLQVSPAAIVAQNERSRHPKKAEPAAGVATSPYVEPELRADVQPSTAAAPMIIVQEIAPVALRIVPDPLPAPAMLSVTGVSTTSCD